MRVLSRLPPREVSSHLEELHRENLRKSKLMTGTEAEEDDEDKHDEKRKDDAPAVSATTVASSSAVTPVTPPPPRRPPVRLPQEVRAPSHADSGSAPPLTSRSKTRLLPQVTSEVKTNPARLIDPELSTDVAPWFILGKDGSYGGLHKGKCGLGLRCLTSRAVAYLHSPSTRSRQKSG